MKYIVFENDIISPFPIIFPDMIAHAEVAANFSKYKILSAGFCAINESEVGCWGKSVSLNVVSDKSQDEKLIHKMTRGY